MTVVLLPNTGFLSETTRMLAVYRELEKLGTPAVIASHGGVYEELLREEGVACERILPTQTLEEWSSLLEILYNPFQGQLYSKRQLLEAVENEIAFFRQIGARVAVSGFTLSASISARAASIPLVVTHMGSCIPPVLERGLFRTSEYLESVFPLFLLPESLQSKFMAWFLPRIQRHAGVFKEVAEELGVEPVRGLFDLMLGDLVLVTDVPEILGIPQEELEGWRPRSSHYRPDLRFSYVGAIYVAMASTQPEFLQHVLDTVEAMGVRALVVTTVHRDELQPKGDVLLYDFLPSHKVMPFCDAAVIHGGQGTVQTAIASGLPFVGIPLQPEQNANLKIIERWGGSRTLSLKGLRKGKLRHKLEEVLGNASFRETLATLKDFQAQRDGPAETAKRLTMLHAG